MIKFRAVKIIISFRPLNTRDIGVDEEPDESDMILVGREDRCDLAFKPWMIREDVPYKVDQISRIHFAIYRQGGKPTLQCNSSNGTYVNEKKLVKGEVMELKTEARISVLGPDLELFWYIDEKAMRGNQRYPRDISKHFAIGNIIGSGTFAKVRKGYVKKDGKPVAIKFIDKNKLRWTYQYSEHDIKSIRSEVQILSTLDHECVTKLWIPGFYDTKDYLIILMEFAEGGELEKQVGYDKTMGRIYERTALIQFYQISHTVAYIHSKNICHRDLKLTNILMTQPEDPECRLKISDFGISKVWTHENQLRTKCGSPLFIAPEVNNASDDRPYTAKADCWALGIILHQLLSGSLPHKTQGRMDTKEWEHISAEAKDLVRGLLEPKAEARLDSSQILYHPWFTCQRNRDTIRKARRVMFGVEAIDRNQEEDAVQRHNYSPIYEIKDTYGDLRNEDSPPTQQVGAEKEHDVAKIGAKAKAMSKDEVMDAAAEALSQIQVNSMPLQKSNLSKESRDISAVYEKAQQIMLNNDTNESNSQSSQNSRESKGYKRQDVHPVDEPADKDVVFDFGTIKSRLRPRNHRVDYFKVNVVKQSKEPQHLHSPNRKRKEVAFILNDGGKRRRRYSEHALMIPDQGFTRDKITTKQSDRKMLRQRRKSGI